MATGIKVKDAMVNRVVTAKPSQTVYEGSQIMLNEDVGSLILTEGSKPIGIVTREDIINKVTAKDKKASEVKLKDIMSKNIISISPDADISEAARLMSKHGFERLPIIHINKLVGIISTREIAKVAPAAIEILRERLLTDGPKSSPQEFNEGECELCGNFSEVLHNINDKWVCSTCKDEAKEL